MENGPEAYRLEIQPDEIRILASGPAGWTYGLHTLADLLESGSPTLACGIIEDHPTFTRRGIYLDCSRGKVPSMATLIALIEQLGAWKINELQLYVENVFTFQRHPAISQGFSPFTPQEILILQDTCRLNHIRFVPSLSSFGHFERTLALPDYAPLGEKPGNWGLPGGTTLCPRDPRSIALVRDLYEEFLPLFDAQDFNACCDETWELGKGRSLRTARRRGTGQVYLEFILKLHKLCNRHGKRMNIWGDIVLHYPDILPQIPRDIVMLNWDYAPRGPRMPKTKIFAEATLPVMICPGTHGWGSHGSRLTDAFSNVRHFAMHGRRHAAEGLLMTDWGDGGHRNPLGVSLPAYAWAAANAWGRPVSADLFLTTYCERLAGADAANVHEVIQTLGSAEKKTGDFLPYYSMNETLLPSPKRLVEFPARSPLCVPAPFHRHNIDAPNPARLEHLIEELNALPRLHSSTGFSHFRRHTIDDLNLATQMEKTACKRMYIGQALRRGKRVSSQDRKQLISDLQALSQHFEKNWLQRNRLSRLPDNLRLFRAAIREARRLQRVY